MRTATGILLLAALTAAGQNAPAPALTIYNQDFAVVREQVRLDVKPGANNIRFDGITAQLEPDSVVLRDPSGKRGLQILEQNYQANPVSQQSLLELFEGKTIDFEITRGDRAETVPGRIVRPGSGMPRYTLFPQPQPCYQPTQFGCTPQEPLIEIAGRLQVGLPGRALFPPLPQGTNIRPTLDWVLQADSNGPGDAELSYVTGGMTWQADYNVIAPPTGDSLDLVGWVTMENRTGKTFENAHIKLMAGDINKIQPNLPMVTVRAGPVGGIGGGYVPQVTEKSFDEYHLYTLERATTLRDRQTKQVELLRASGVPAHRVYVYDGDRIDPTQMQPGNWQYLRYQRDLGGQENTKVWVMQEFKNSEQNHLGMALPKGRVRFYRRDDSGGLQFIGENTIDHTPRDETIRVYTGNTFDLVGSRRRTDFRSDQAQAWIDESFEIKVRSHKKEPVQVTVAEHLYRAAGWNITTASSKYQKKDSHTVEFPVTIQPDGEVRLTYSVHYTW